MAQRSVWYQLATCAYPVGRMDVQIAQGDGRIDEDEQTGFKHIKEGG